MIKEPINITVFNSYNIENWEEAIIRRCAEDNPSSNLRELSELLNISERTLYRKCVKYNLALGWGKTPGPESFDNKGKIKKK